jgi:hypothetical protein
LNSPQKQTFFKIFKVDLESECPFWRRFPILNSKLLEIIFVQEIEILMNLQLVLFVNVMKQKYQNLGKFNLKALKNKIHFQNLLNLGMMNKRTCGFQSKMNQVFSKEFKFLELTYVNLLLNPEGLGEFVD